MGRSEELGREVYLPESRTAEAAHCPLAQDRGPEKQDVINNRTLKNPETSKTSSPPFL